MLRGEMPIGKLAGLLGMERTTLTRNLTLLEQRKWISIRPGDDPRARIIDITAPGRASCAAAFRSGPKRRPMSPACWAPRARPH